MCQVFSLAHSLSAFATFYTGVTWRYFHSDSLRLLCKKSLIDTFAVDVAVPSQLDDAGWMLDDCWRLVALALPRFETRLQTTMSTGLDLGAAWNAAGWTFSMTWVDKTPTEFDGSARCSFLVFTGKIPESDYRRTSARRKLRVQDCSSLFKSWRDALTLVSTNLTKTKYEWNRDEDDVIRCQHRHWLAVDRCRQCSLEMPGDDLRLEREKGRD